MSSYYARNEGTKTSRREIVVVALKRLNPHYKNPDIYWRCLSCGLLWSIDDTAFRWYMHVFFEKVYIHELLDSNAKCCEKPRYMAVNVKEDYSDIARLNGTQNMGHTITKKTLKEWVKWDLILRSRPIDVKY